MGCVPRTLVTARDFGVSESFLQRWLKNAAVDVHADDPALGYRFISDEIEAVAALSESEPRVWRLCSQRRLRSVFSNERGLNRKARPPVQEDLGRLTPIEFEIINTEAAHAA